MKMYRYIEISLPLLFLATPATACEFFGGAMPAACPPEATQEWWDGAWATREVDQKGAKLTAFTVLMPANKYKTTLAFDDGRKLEHWGHYQIHVSASLSNSLSEENVPDLAAEAENIDKGVQQSIKNGAMQFGGALPSSTPPQPRSGRKQCLRGKIDYFVEDSNPRINYSSPQRFSFITQGEGYVRVTGPGAHGVLARKYMQ